ncbi:addiction module toxin RelE [Candidatus Woesearchaeota archaeon]|nr:addiction module toxin RelE [Candidatus Woesearchaeota archaeon]
MFSFDVSDEIKRSLAKLLKRDPVFCKAVNNKIREIINNNHETINHYKNLKYDLSDNKRVHVYKSFVLTFKVRKDINFIYFEKLEHHDDIYK